MSEAAWVCKNPECGIMFQWNRMINVAAYSDDEEEPKSNYVPGKTRPEGCPKCGCPDVDSMEG